VKNWFTKRILILLIFTCLFPALRSDSAIILFQRTQEAIDTPFEPERNPDYNGLPGTLTADNVQEAIEELDNKVAVSASPGFSWGKGGSAGRREWLYNEDVECNKTGRVVPFSDAQLLYLFVSNSESVTCTIRLYEHQGGSKTVLASISLTGQRAKSQAYTGVNITKDYELCARVWTGDCKDVVVGAIISGTSI
jgi:hypothetical protein